MTTSEQRTANFKNQPLWFRLLNKIWRSSYPFGTMVRLDKDDLIKRARRITGLQDFGSDFNEEPLDIMLRSLNEEAGLSPAGRYISRERLVNLLNVRLRAEAWFRRFPEILEQELYPAWIIVGLQRTGTTKLHRLLATDPDHRVIPSWEVLHPVPIAPPPSSPPQLGRGLRGGADKRFRLARTSARAVRMISPNFYAIHPIEIYEPEEDVLLLDVTFMSTTTEAMVRVPSYTSWLESIDQSSAYAYYVRLLKLLQWIRPAKRWLLKSPHHLEFFDQIEKQMGEVHYIWPHRSLSECIPSFLSMLTYNHMIFSEKVDPHEIGKRWVRKTGYVLQKAFDYRKEDKNNRKFTDIRYRDLITDSIPVLERIYRYNGGLTPDLIKGFRLHEAKHPYRKHGIHTYSMDDFGMTGEYIDRHTTHYKQFIASLDDKQPAEEIR